VSRRRAGKTSPCHRMEKENGVPAEADALQTTHLREARAFDLDSEAPQDGLVHGLARIERVRHRSALRERAAPFSF
jgi:hypothetical protein